MSANIYRALNEALEEAWKDGYNVGKNEAKVINKADVLDWLEDIDLVCIAKNEYEKNRRREVIDLFLDILDDAD